MAVKELMASLEMKDLTKESCKMLSETKLCCQLSCPMKYKLMNSLTLRYRFSCIGLLTGCTIYIVTQFCSNLASHYQCYFQYRVNLKYVH